MKKSILKEEDLRRIVNRVVRRKLITEQEEETTGTPAPEESKPESNPESKPEEEKEKTKDSASTPDITDIKNIMDEGGLDNLAKKEGNGAQRGGEAVLVGGTAAGLTYALATAGAITVGTGGLGAPVAAAMLLGAGLYYVFSPDAVVSSEAVTEALDTTLYTRVSQAFKQMYNKFRKSSDPKVKELAKFINPDECLKKGILSPKEISTIAQELYDATQGGLTGIGTDEDGVEAALKKCKSFLGVSQVSLKHAKIMGGIIDDGNLYKVLTGEFNTTDFDRYVTSTIESLPFIFIGDKGYSKSEFVTWLDETKDMIEETVKKAEPEPSVVEPEGVDDYVKECQRLMNDYCANKDLDYTPIKPDGKWGPRTNRLWLNPYLPHVLENHPEISQVKVTISGRGRWSDISAQLIGTFPGYTPGQKGCYRFCKDALSGKSTLGKQKGGNDEPIKYFGGGGGGRRRSRPEQDEVVPIPGKREGESSGGSRRRTDGRLDYRNIVIDVDIAGERGINTLDQLPGAKRGDGLEFAYDFLGNFRGSRLSIKNPGETFQLDIYPDGKKNKIKVKNARGTRLFKRSQIRDFASNFKRYFQSIDVAKLKEMGVGKDSPLVMKVKMPPGVYNASTKRLHESERRRNLINKKLKNIIY